MKTRFALIAAAALTAGSAFAQFPAASGMGPLFQDEANFTSTTTREAVRPHTLAEFPASGDQTVTATAKTQPSSLTHAEVREQTREAIAQGHGPASGIGG